MDISTLQSIFLGLLLSGVLGALIGLDKDIGKHKKGILEKVTKSSTDYNFGSIRSFSLIALLGSLMTWLDIYIGTEYIFILSGLFLTAFLVGTHYIYSVFKNEEISPVVPALQFAALIVLIKFISGVGIVYKDIWGEGLFYSALGIISGLADVDAITQTMAVDSGAGNITFAIAASTVLLAVMSNNFVKGSIAWRLGNPEFGKKVMGSFLLSIFAGLIVIGVQNIF